MPAKVKTPTRRQPGIKWFRGPGSERFKEAPQAGTAPQSIMQEENPPKERAGGGTMHPLGGTQRNRPKQQLAPASPFVAAFPMLAPGVAGRGLGVATERRLTTIPTEVQEAFRSAITAAGEPHTDESYDRIMDAYGVLAVTPGAPTFEDLAPLARALESIQSQADLSAEEAAAARGVLIGGGGPDAPEPTDEEITDMAIELRTQEAIDMSIITPTQSAEPYTPEEDFQAAEEEE